MIDGCEKRNRQLAFELQNSHVSEKRSNNIPTKDSSVDLALFLQQVKKDTASLPVVLGDFGCEVTCQACRENSRCHARFQASSRNEAEKDTYSRTYMIA